MQTLCAGCIKAESKFFAPPQTPFPGRPKFNQLEMVTTFTYKPTLVRIDCMQYRVIMVTYPQTHKPGHRQDRLQYTALQLARTQCNKSTTKERSSLACHSTRSTRECAQDLVNGGGHDTMWQWPLIFRAQEVIAKPPTLGQLKVIACTKSGDEPRSFLGIVWKYAETWGAPICKHRKVLFVSVETGKKRSERCKHCTLAVVKWSQKFCPVTDPLHGGAGRQKFNQLEMVTYRPSLVKIDVCNLFICLFQVIVVTDPQTNKPTNTYTNRTNYNTLHR